MLVVSSGFPSESLLRRRCATSSHAKRSSHTCPSHCSVNSASSRGKRNSDTWPSDCSIAAALYHRVRGSATPARARLLASSPPCHILTTPAHDRLLAPASGNLPCVLTCALPQCSRHRYYRHPYTRKYYSRTLLRFLWIHSVFLCEEIYIQSLQSAWRKAAEYRKWIACQLNCQLVLKFIACYDGFWILVQPDGFWIVVMQK
jgi:hypothetical protein